MPLPGKLSVGILEEDNPQESYFRYKPVLIESEGKFIPFEEAGLYPDDGCLRIVPDKNESSHFKIRMRRIGRYCAVDLRNHPGENDKIRLNKNYNAQSSERNMNIIYSDVVREPAAVAFLEVYDALPEEAGSGMIAVGEGEARSVYARAEEGYAPAENAPDLAGYQEFEFAGKQVLVAAPAVALPQAEPRPQRPAPEPRVQPAPVQTEKPDPRPVEKPWISHDYSIRPQKVDPRMSPREQSIALQTGFNPRRGRSLQEIIEEKWRHSRMEQLGHPVPGGVTGMPAESPVDRAVSAVKQVWDSREARGVLVGNLSRIEGFGREMADRAGNALSEEVAARVQELEEKKARLMGEVEELHRANLHPAEEIPQLDADAGRALIARVKAYFAACGCPRTNEEIVTMLAAAAQGKVLVFTGAPGSGAQDAARMLADSLGWPEAKLFEEPAVPGKEENLTKWAGVRFFANANARRRAMDHAVELIAMAGDSRVWLGAQDNTAGAPVPGSVLEQAFVLRLAPESAEAPFAAPARPESAAEVGFDALRRAFAPDEKLPQELLQRMQALRSGLSFHGAGLSRAVLNDLWRFLAGALRYLEMPPLKALDLALSVRVIPGLVATLPLKTLTWLPDALADMPCCQKILQEPLAIEI